MPARVTASSRETAVQLTAEAMGGTAALLREVGTAEVRERVATPGGVTERGLAVMEERGVPDALGAVVDVVVEATRAMTLWLAIDRVDVADYLNTLLLVYLVLIFVRIIMSWIPRIPYNRVLDMVLTFVKDVTDPYLNLFRRFIPPVRMGPGALDLSPIVAIFVLIIVGGIVVDVVDG